MTNCSFHKPNILPLYARRYLAFSAAYIQNQGLVFWKLFRFSFLFWVWQQKLLSIAEKNISVGKKPAPSDSNEFGWK